MNHEIEKYFPIVQAVVELFHPYVEGAVHDLQTGEMVAIFNNFSKRKIGDKTPLKELKINTDKFPDIFPSYYKVNWDGKKLKSTSITIRDEKKQPIGLICFNLNTSSFLEIERVIKSLLNVKAKTGNPVEVFSNDWEQKILDFIQEYLNEHQTSLEQITTKDKQEMVRDLYNSGYFNYKYAVKYVAGLLKISKATIYNYLK